MKKQKGPGLFFVLLIIFIGFCIAGLYFLSKTSERSQLEQLKDYKSFTYDFDYKNQPFIGKEDAPVSIVKIGDFKCPACQMWESEVYPSLKKEFIDTGKVKMYFINYPFLAEDSHTAALVGESIFAQNPASFWEYYDAVYQNQQAESKTWATPEFLLSLAKKHVKNIDFDQLEKDIKNKTYQKEVDRDLSIIKEAQIQGTPTIFVNNTIVDGPIKNPSTGKFTISTTPFDYEKIKSMINEDLQKARK